ncbi:MAG: sulfatase-like hydrolase/transferase [Phycisphaerales bacterium]|nr:sulfatase-like hydrolase/transferase [Phycisphaerales bacterium]
MHLPTRACVLTKHFATTPLCFTSTWFDFHRSISAHNGLMGLIPQGSAIQQGERTLPMILRDHGYRTALIGQQHENHRPQTLGFQTMRLLEYWQTCDGIEPLAIEYLEREATQTQPFFASIGFFEVHRLGADHYPRTDTRRSMTR